MCHGKIATVIKNPEKALGRNDKEVVAGATTSLSPDIVNHMSTKCFSNACSAL